MDEDAHAAWNARGLKMHLRIVPVGATTYRVATLRPATAVRFSSNYYHDTWHVLTGRTGALVLGRLFWGLAFQRQPGTVVMIDTPHLVPTPFEADPADPILLIPEGLTAVDAASLGALRARLPSVPTTTIRWHTFGLPAALAARASRWDGFWKERRPAYQRERTGRLGGFVCYTAAPSLLREHAVGIYEMSDGYHPLAERRGTRGWFPEGEVQVFADFDRDVAAAAVARREVLGPAARPLTGDDERHRVWDRKLAVDARVASAARRRR